MTEPAPDGIPLTARTAALPDDTPCTRLDTLDSVILTLRLGESTHNTAREICRLVADDSLLAAICAAWGITAPPHEVRRDPVAALGPLARLLVGPGIIPPQLARRRA